jgi:hypothetical protein
MRQIARRYIVSLIFTFDLVTLVGLSEIIRLLLLDSVSNTTLLNVGKILFFSIVIIPLVLVCLWRISAVGVEKLLVTFGLTEATIEGTEKISKKSEQEQSEETESEKLKREFRNRAT